MEEKKQDHERVDFYYSLIKMLKKEHARCSKCCSCWNSIDHDCEIMGENHRTPSTCPIYWQSAYEQYKKGDFELC